ncbi:hypothetical protein EWO52_22585, partial [Salmonella enterica]|nr:hypothetical protein [Salmonella enterica]
ERSTDLVPGAWCLVPGAWCLVPGAWCLVPGAWCLVPGAWCLVPVLILIEPQGENNAHNIRTYSC